MTRAYVRVDPGFYERKALVQGYPLGAVAALVGCFCLAESQPTRGSFRDRKVLAVLLGPAARWIAYLVEHGDLIEREELPRLYIDGWHEWQEGDLTVPERMARMRAKKGKRVTASVTPDVTAPVTAARQTESVEAEAEAQDKSGGGAPYNGAPKPGYRRPTEPARLPGEAAGPRHEGQHPDCLVCAPIRAASEMAAKTPAATARPRSAAS